jgi:hypothetical protein
MRVWSIAALGVFIASTIGAPGANGRTWRVNAAGTGDAPTIQAAIDSSAANDTVLVAPGTYTQAAILILKECLTVTGEGGAENTVLHTTGYAIMLTGVSCVTIKGFTFEDGADGALGVTCFTSNDIVIEENVFRNNHGREAISIVSIFPERMIRDSPGSGIVIRRNLIYSNCGGIGIGQWAGGVEICQNTISHNSPGHGIMYHDWICTNTVHHNIISYNEIGVEGFCAGDFLCNDIFGNKSNVDPPPFGTNGNISIDPEFCGVEPGLSGNFLLQSDSPCAPGNHPDGESCGIIGACAIGCGTTSVKRATWGSMKSIFR